MEDILREKLSRLNKVLSDKFGPPYLFAANFDSDARAWHLLVSADWLEQAPSRGIYKISSELAKSLKAAERDLIARIVFIPKSSRIVWHLSQLFTIGKSDVTFENCNINGIVFEELVVFECHNPMVGSDTVEAALRKRQQKTKKYPGPKRKSTASSRNAAK